MITVAVIGDARIEASHGTGRFVGTRRDGECSWAQFLSAVTKHGWIPTVSITKAAKLFEPTPEGFGMDEPLEGEETGTTPPDDDEDEPAKGADADSEPKRGG